MLEITAVTRGPGGLATGRDARSCDGKSSGTHFPLEPPPSPIQWAASFTPVLVAHVDHLDQSRAQQIILFRGGFLGFMSRLEIAGVPPAIIANAASRT